MKLFLTILLLFIAADVLIVGYIVYRRLRKKLPEKTVEKIRSSWKQLIRQSDRRHAIMDADKLLDFTLGEMGYRGNLGNKLKKAPKLFSDINHVWKAHKVRNNIAHQINYQVSEGEYKTAMLAFKQAFKDLHIF